MEMWQIIACGYMVVGICFSAFFMWAITAVGYHQPVRDITIGEIGCFIVIFVFVALLWFLPVIVWVYEIVNRHPKANKEHSSLSADESC